MKGRLVGMKHTDLLHDARLSLGEGNVSTRLVADELYFNLATLTAAFLIIVIFIVGGNRTRALYTAPLGDGITIAHRVWLVEVGGGGLVVMVGDVGHCGWCLRLERVQQPCRRDRLPGEGGER